MRLLIAIELIIVFFGWAIVTLAIMLHPIEKVEAAQQAIGQAVPNFRGQTPQSFQRMLAIAWPVLIAATLFGFCQHAFFPVKEPKA